MSLPLNQSIGLECQLQFLDGAMIRVDSSVAAQVKEEWVKNESKILTFTDIHGTVISVKLADLCMIAIISPEARINQAQYNSTYDKLVETLYPKKPDWETS